MSEQWVIDSITRKLGKEIQPEEPKMYSIQLEVRGPVQICLTAVELANRELGTVARYKGDLIFDVIDSVFDKSDWLDITKEMPKDIAEAKMTSAVEQGRIGRLICGCGKNFTLRLGKAD